MTDCRPISLFSLQTARQLGEEVGAVLDKRRFRANVYLDLGATNGFSENGLVGRRVQIGSGCFTSNCANVAPAGASVGRIRDRWLDVVAVQREI